MRDNQSGNVLFLILIAVALFAALSYAVTQSNRGGGEIDKEATEIKAAQYVQYVSSIKYAIAKMKIINGCDDTEITFYNAPTNSKCGIFEPDGGAVPTVDRPVSCCGLNRESIIDGFDFSLAGSSCGGSDLIHISMQRHWIKGIGEDYEQDLSIVACGEGVQKICDALDLHDDPTTTAQFIPFLGVYDTTTTDPFIRQIGFSGGASLVGRDIACIGNGATKFMYTTVLER